MIDSPDPLDLRLVTVTVQAEFVMPDGEYLTPVKYGPVSMTAKEWAEFDLEKTASGDLLKQVTGQ
jgi:hypothetical protein